MRHKTTDKYFQRVCEALNECDIRLPRQSKTKGVKVAGWYLSETISVSTKEHPYNPVHTIIHEALHHIYPKWTEKRIDKLARTLHNEFSERQLKSLGTYLRRKKCPKKNF